MWSRCGRPEGKARRRESCYSLAGLPPPGFFGDTGESVWVNSSSLIARCQRPVAGGNAAVYGATRRRLSAGLDALTVSAPTAGHGRLRLLAASAGVGEPGQSKGNRAEGDDTGRRDNQQCSTQIHFYLLREESLRVAFTDAKRRRLKADSHSREVGSKEHFTAGDRARRRVIRKTARAGLRCQLTSTRAANSSSIWAKSSSVAP